MIHYKLPLTGSLAKSILAAGLSLILASSALAAEPDTAWTLDSCINYAVSHNLNVRGWQYEQLSGEVAVDAAKDKFLPRANAYASQSFAFGRGLNAENTYSDRNTSTFSWGAQAELTLFQ
ncbi:MAG: TolC family protein [Paramuribaculum sp.]|nr:TolC family protein [Paramuribaculum sp.]